MSTLKGDIINDAFSRIRISGVTIAPDGVDNGIALMRLEDMIASWQNWNIVVPYNREETPDLGTPHGLPRDALQAVKAQLAIWLLADYGKATPETLVMEARAGFSQLMAKYASVRSVPYPARMPIGSGNSHFRGPGDRFYPGGSNPEASFEALGLYTEDIKDLEESFQYDLRSDNTETITTYSISADTELTIVSDSLASPIISYRLQAGTLAKELRKVTIKATTSLGQVITRVKYFNIVEA